MNVDLMKASNAMVNIALKQFERLGKVTPRQLKGNRTHQTKNLMFGLKLMKARNNTHGSTSSKCRSFLSV